MLNRIRLLLKNLSIHYRLLWSYSLTFLFVLSLAGFVIYSVVRTTIEENIEKELKNSTKSILNMVETAIDVSIRNHLRGIAETNKELITDLYHKVNTGVMSPQEAKESAKQILLSQSIGKSGYIYSINHEGIIQIHPKDELVGRDLSKYDFIKIQKAKKGGYVEYDWANPGEKIKRPKALYMTYFAPWDWIISVSSYRAEFKELLNIDDFRQNVLSITFGKTGYPYIMDSNGLLVIHPKLTGTNIYNSKDDNRRMFIKEICEQKNGKIIYPWKNPDESKAREKLVIFNYISELDWIVASSSYLEEFYHPLNAIAYSIGATLLITIVLIVPITWLISSRLAKPLQAMISLFATGAQTGFSRRLDVKWGGEMDEVAKNYNRFIGTLEATRRQLEKSRHELEQKVAERTAQLSKTVSELEALFNNSQVGIMVLKGGRLFHRGNQRLADILGYDAPAEMQGFSMKELHLNEERFHEFGNKYFGQLKSKKMLQIEYQLKRKDGSSVWCVLSGKALDTNIPADLNEGVVWILDDISNKKRNEIERERLLADLQDALSEVKQLSGLLPICAHCKKIRDDKGYWNTLEAYIEDRSDASFSHGMCDECSEKLYGDEDWYIEMQKDRQKSNRP